MPPKQRNRPAKKGTSAEEPAIVRVEDHPAVRRSAERVVSVLKTSIDVLKRYEPGIHPDGTVLGGVDLQAALHKLYHALRNALQAIVDDDLVFNLHSRSFMCDLVEVMQVVKEKMGWIAAIHTLYESDGSRPNISTLERSYGPMLVEAVQYCLPQLQSAHELYCQWT